MSFLAPLFFVAAAAIAAPIIFHLIRRETKSRMEFSSLMFIQPSPPRVTRRSRVDNWLLLLLRAIAVLLVAAAFTRPFFRTLGQTTTVRPSSFTVLLVDKSASMKRDDLWQQAIARVAEEIQRLGPSDRLAIVTFDDSVDVLRSLQATGEESPETALADLRAQTPGWLKSNLGGAMLAAVEMIDETLRSEDEGTAEQTIVVISDLQRSSQIGALRGTEWPKSMRVRLAPLVVKSPTNAAISVAPIVAPIGSSETTPAPSEEKSIDKANSNRYRVKVSNSEKAGVGTFSLKWLDAKLQKMDSSPGEAEKINVPPGTNRMVNLVAPRSKAVALEIAGDDYEYDNRFYVIVPEPLQQRLIMVGDKVADPRDSLYYYLEKLPLDKPGRSIQPELVAANQFSTVFPEASLEPAQVPLVVMHEFLEASEMERIARYVESGGKVLAVLDQTAVKSPKTEAGLKILTGDVGLSVQSAEMTDYAIFSRVDFKSEVFGSLADPRYSDFSKIQFWNHANLSLPSGSSSKSSSETALSTGEVAPEPSWNMLASFDNGQPALARIDLGKGYVYVLAAGWQPTESQLALSTKFVPMISGILGNPDRGGAWESLVLGEALSLPPSSSAKLTLPGGEEVPYLSSADLKVIDQPGIYRWQDGDQVRSFAVNFPASESDFGVMDRAVLEQLGVEFEDAKKEAVLQASERQKRDTELEQQQNVWRWLLVTALGLIGLETLLGTRSRKT